jgi:hypothetical protein
MTWLRAWSRTHFLCCAVSVEKSLGGPSCSSQPVMYISSSAGTQTNTHTHPPDRLAPMPPLPGLIQGQFQSLSLVWTLGERRSATYCTVSFGHLRRCHEADHRRRASLSLREVGPSEYQLDYRASVCYQEKALEGVSERRRAATTCRVRGRNTDGRVKSTGPA